MTSVDVASIAPLRHDEAMGLQATELDRTLRLLRSLEPADWGAQTDCPDWDVRQLYLHVLGACEGGARIRENVHQLRRASSRRRQQGGPLEAALSSVQVEERADLTPTDVVDRLAAVAPLTVRGRRRIPALVRDRVKIPVDGPVAEKWSVGYLSGTIYLRDLWMHRIDAARATNREVELTAGHDGRIVADVVREWAGRHRQPFSLELTGPAGATYVSDVAGTPTSLTLDAVEFCRTLAGRSEGSGLLTTIVPF